MTKLNLEKYTISDTQLIEDAIEVIEMNHSRCVIVVNNDQKVVGVISEGDVLRSILKGVSIKSSVRQIMITNFKYLTTKDDEKISSIFKKGITLIPILDHNHKVIEVIDYVNYIKSLT
jgi:CBS domain-containing protein